MKSRRILVSLDTDFADIRAYPPSMYAGIIVLRLDRQDKVHILQIVSRLLSVIDREEMEGCLWIASEEHIRIKK